MKEPEHRGEYMEGMRRVPSGLVPEGVETYMGEPKMFDVVYRRWIYFDPRTREVVEAPCFNIDRAEYLINIKRPQSLEDSALWC